MSVNDSTNVRREDTPRGPRIVIPQHGEEWWLSEREATRLRDEITAALGGGAGRAPDPVVCRRIAMELRSEIDCRPDEIIVQLEAAAEIAEHAEGWRLQCATNEASLRRVMVEQNEARSESEQLRDQVADLQRIIDEEIGICPVCGAAAGTPCDAGLHG